MPKAFRVLVGWLAAAALVLAAPAAVLIAAAPAAVLIAAAPAAVASAAHGAKATNTRPIVVGGVWSASTYGGADVGARAAFDAFNAAGGLDGRKIQFIGMVDDGQSPTQDIAAAKTLVQRNVFAVVPVMTEAWVAGNVLEKAHIPYFGWGISTGWWKSPNGFSYVGANPPSPKDEPRIRSVATLICMTAKGGCKGKTVALVAINNASALNSLQLFAAEWKQAGAKVVEELTSLPEPPAVVSDFTPYVDQLLTSNHGKQPDIVQQVLPPQDDIGIIAQLEHQGFKGQNYNFSLYDPRAAGVAKGSYTLISSAPWEQQSSAVATMTQQVRATDPNVLLGQPTEAGYWSAQLLIAALKKAGPSVTPASLISTMNKGFTFEIPGGTGPVSFPADHQAGGGCSAIVTSNGTKYSVALPLTCTPLIPNPLLHP